MTTPEKILVIQLRRIGDNLLTLPALAALKAKFPAARVDFLAEPPADKLLAGSPFIDELLVYNRKHQFYWLREIRRRKYDWVIDYLGNPRSIAIAAASGAKIRAGAKDVFWSFLYNIEMKRGIEPAYAPLEKIMMLAPLGITPDMGKILPQLSPDANAVKSAREFLAAHGLEPGRVIGVAPASRRETRQYPPELFAEALKIIHAETGFKAVILWGPGERETAEKVAAAAAQGCAVLSPETKNLVELTGLISQFGILITNCNGPKHIAVATGVSTLTIHASSDPRNWTPPSPVTGAPARTVADYFGALEPKAPAHLYISRTDLPCIPCRRNECENLACLRGLPAREVAAAAIDIIKLAIPSTTSGKS